MNDRHFPFDPEDPRLTAYALGELHDPADRAAVEQTLQSSPEARDALREIRAFTALLTAEYEQERTLAETPTNVIAMPPNWPRRLLLAAAMLLLLASVVGVMEHQRNANTRSVLGDQKFKAGPVLAGQVQETILPLPTIVPGNLVPAQSSTPALLIASAAPPSVSSGSGASVTVDQNFAGAYGSVDRALRPEPFAKGDTLDLSGRIVSRNPIGVTIDQNRPDAYGRATTTRLIGRKPVDSLAAVPVPTQAKAASVNGGVMPEAPKHIDVRSLAANTFTGTASFGDDKVPVVVNGYDKLSGSSVIAASADASAAAPAPVSRAALGKPIFRGGPNTATYDHLTENSFLPAKDNPLSTFSIDVDTASYANVRRFIESGSLPPPDAVRVEELVNYFPYNYAPPAPDDQAHPFAVHLEAASCPWNPQDRLVRIGIKGRELARDKRPASNLVFLIDVSGSMEPPERLPLIKAALRMLVEQLTENDRVAIVTYAGESGVALPSTTGDHKDDILRALDKLEAGGSTNGASGIKMAYKVAREGFIQGGTNRVILATDGDFNVGVTSQGDLVRLIEGEAKSGVFLSALGVGTDNYKDATMQKLADKGNGNYAYIDKLDEARKVLVEQMSGTLVTVAKDVKIQVEFNPATVAAYRLVGYEKRMLRKEDFNDDRIDAGEIGAGHRVTALYEIVPIGGSVPGATPAVDALRYGNVPVPPLSFMATPTPAGDSPAAPKTTGELLTVKMRHKAPDGDRSERSYEESLTDHAAPNDFANASPDFKFAAAVASFGLVLRDSSYKGSATLGAAIELAQDGKGADPGEYRAGFIELARKAQAIEQRHGE